MNLPLALPGCKILGPFDLIREVFMYQINPFPIFTMGGSLTLLTERLNTKNYTFNDLARDAASPLENLVTWIRNPYISAPLSKEAARVIAEILHAASSVDYLKEHGREEIKGEQKTDLAYQVHNFASLLRAELSYSDLYAVSQKRAYDMKKLIFSAEDNLDAKTIEHLSPSCVADIREAGRCVAFDLSTAAGFHIFRALEAVVLMYFPVVGLQALDEKMRNLGNYFKLLEGKEVGGQKIAEDKVVDGRVVGVLKHLKDTYRNPLMHPELVLTSDEAQDLFQFAISTISTMVRDIIARKGQAEVATEEEQGL